MMRFIKNFCLCLCCLAVVTACSGKQKPPLKGERVAVLAPQSSDTALSLAASEKTAQQSVILDPPAEGTAWALPNGTASGKIPHSALATGLKQRWRADIGKGSTDESRLIARPVVDKGRIYTADSQGVISAFNAVDGKRLWVVELTDDSDELTMSPQVSVFGNTVYVSDDFGRVTALNASNGKTIWQQAYKIPLRSPVTVADNRLFVTSLSDETLALNPADGTILWRHQGVQEMTGLLGSPGPSVADGAVLSLYSSGDIVALRIETGQEAWDDNLSGLVAMGGAKQAVTHLSGFRGGAVIDQGVVYVGNAGSKLVAIHIPSGDRLWQKEFGVLGTPVLNGNSLFALTNTQDLTALDRETGLPRWSVTLPRYEDPDDREDLVFWQGPVLGGGLLYVVGSNEKMLAIDPATGKTIKSYDLSAKAMLAPVIADKTLYIVLDNGTLTAWR